ncbi:hypothetical protein ASPWEDRAFT_33838 [Aspergillus wentii DTO 134E9]|uniref:Uncharacterized protein n=1 Tax=Aspergillus wentii DTO 134E9 TaxID=1073089 RepID=A0A1L9RZT6_ASPWE|nr:uncharacterized protein ASPWEDRAFT_33838 [Aspergillus wentii DTO 134E9]OJJ40442.1 hypothetical protein ASPWEDRAFT_33838 [Aspergillus wentii DTO 134E9]
MMLMTMMIILSSRDSAIPVIHQPPQLENTAGVEQSLRHNLLSVYSVHQSLLCYSTTSSNRKSRENAEIPGARMKP